MCFLGPPLSTLVRQENNMIGPLLLFLWSDGVRGHHQYSVNERTLRVIIFISITDTYEISREGGGVNTRPMRQPLLDDAKGAPGRGAHTVPEREALLEACEPCQRLGWRVGKTKAVC